MDRLAPTQALSGYAGNWPLSTIGPLGLAWWNPTTWTGEPWATVGLTVARGALDTARACRFRAGTGFGRNLFPWGAP